ncbi:signal peptidase I [Sphingomonas sp.]|uniref:signal peptidase I n=1 Tax=Sphingomonas sp. TaxID=28214 RepID=UPI0025CEFF15|nr:signal peptidase I [Sphingomonas sp.]
MSETPAAPIPAPAKHKSETRDFAEFLVKLAIFVFILRSFIFAPFSIPSESMLPRLFVGDYLIVTKWNYGYSKHSLPWSMPLIPGRVFAKLPERGDVIVFKSPPANDTDLIKRVIGLPGDFIQMRDGQLFINGAGVPKVRVADFVQPVSPNTHCLTPAANDRSFDGKPICRYMQFRETLPGSPAGQGKSYNVLDFGVTPQDNTQVYTVPEGMIFMMGDDRDDSGDSRFEAGGFGFVPIENIVGKAQFSVFSTDGSANWILPWTWVSAARWRRIGEGF